MGLYSDSKSLHWLILGLLMVQFVFAWTMPHIGRNTSPTTLIDLHFSFDLSKFPRIMATHEPSWGWAGDAYGFLADYAMLALAGLHVAAALHHYVIRRDSVLQRMLPAM